MCYYLFAMPFRAWERRKFFKTLALTKLYFGLKPNF